MLPLRVRWPDRVGFILAMAGVGLGLFLVRPGPMALSGVHLLVWVVALATLVMPLVVLELSVGVIYQDSLPGSFRKAAKHLEWLGWLGTGTAFLVLSLVAVVAGDLLVSAYDSLLAATTGQSLAWAPRSLARGEAGQGPDAEILAGAVVLVLVALRLRRGALGFARTAVLLVPVGCFGLALVALALATRTGSVDGVARMLVPAAGEWRQLLAPGIWLDAYAQALVTWMVGLGSYAAFGSGLNRSSDITGVATIAVLATGCGQLLALLVVFMAGSVAAGAMSLAAGQPLAPQPLLAGVATAIASLDWPLPGIALLAVGWFVAVLSFALLALMALAEAVVAPLVDKFRLPRERAILVVCLAAFFAAALLSSRPGQDLATLGWSGLGCAVAVLAGVQVLVAWWKVDLDAIQRHLSAYSAISVGGGWRWVVILAVPAFSLALVGQRLFQAPAAGVPSLLWLVVLASVLGLAALVVAMLPSRAL
jgi:NSS family neurotransmitter:Na+ symporter